MSEMIESLKPTGYIHYPLRQSERIQDIEAYKVKGDCLAPEICDGDFLIINKSLTPKDNDIVVAYWRGIVARYRISQDDQSYLENGYGVYEIPCSATCGVVVAINRKLRGVI